MLKSLLSNKPEKELAGRLFISTSNHALIKAERRLARDALIAAGISRVVACMEDPNPLVSGKGFAKLRDAGVDVSSGILQEQAKTLNESFAKYIRCHTPLVTLKAAMTLDGKIAPPPTQSSNPIRAE